MGEYALDTFVFLLYFKIFWIELTFAIFRYTQVKAVHINIGQKI